MNLSKAFDSLNHELLIAKLKFYGLDQNAVGFFRSYQCCKIDNTLGDWRNIIVGVPQRSILGPLLFNTSLNDIFLFLNDANLGNYADDSALYGYNKSLETVICNIRPEFSLLSNWFYDNYIVLNPGKCHFMLFGVKENEQFDLICNIITLKHSSHEKILGVTTDDKLFFDEHVINICKTANKKLNALCRINRYVKQNQKEILLSSFMIYHFSYYPLIWMFCSKKSNKKINAVHERSLQIIRNDYESDH